MKNQTCTIAILSVILLVMLTACASDKEKVMTGSETSNIIQPATPKTYTGPPAMSIDTSKNYKAVIELAKGGEIILDLFQDKTPVTVNNFVFLAQDGYYDGVTFHRVIPNFMAQTGDPTGTGSGSPGYKFDNELDSTLRHDGPGVVAMANAGEINGRGTNGGQFYITFAAAPHIDGFNQDGSPKNCSSPNTSCHTVFGKVIDGMENVNSITVRDPGTPSVPGDVIKKIYIVIED